MARFKTKYPGVFFRERQRPGGTGTEKVFYVVFKRDGKMIEEKVGCQYADDMTPAKAATKRGQLMEGKLATRTEKRTEKLKKVWTIGELWQEYKTHRPMTKTLSIDNNRYHNYIAPLLANKEPKNIVPLDIDRLRIKLLRTKSPQTVKHVVGIIKRICLFGQNKALCSGLNFRPQMPPVDNKKTEDLTKEQLQRLLEAIDADENRQVATMMKMALFTGMRRSELFRLQWEHVDFRQGFIRIVGPKGGKEQKIPINSAARQLLENHNRTDSPHVFPGKDGGQRVSAQKALRRIRERAGLPKDFRPLHGLRHTFASELASSGEVDMYVLQRLLTHKSPVMTQRYAHLRDGALKRGAEVAAGIFDNEEAETKRVRTQGHKE
ncbi:MAG: tyrosine-type recombinase/integrase [Desulfobulbia bacterium]